MSMAEGVGFEPTVTLSATTAFEAAPFVRSGNLPPLRVPKFVEKDRLYSNTGRNIF